MALKILSVVGARPNFMKAAAICEAIARFNNLGAAERVHHILVHTGQHYDTNMSDSFFNDLDLPKPDLCLEVGSASHSVQTAKIMERFEAVVLDQQPDVVLVVGDVTLRLLARSSPKKHGAAVTTPQRTLFLSWRMLKLACGDSTARCRRRSIASSRIQFRTISLQPRKAPIRI